MVPPSRDHAQHNSRTNDDPPTRPSYLFLTQVCGAIVNDHRDGRIDTFSNAIDNRLQGSIAARSPFHNGTGFNEWTLCHARHMLACYRLGQSSDRGFQFLGTPESRSCVLSYRTALAHVPRPQTSSTSQGFIVECGTSHKPSRCHEGHFRKSTTSTGAISQLVQVLCTTLAQVPCTHP